MQSLLTFLLIKFQTSCQSNCFTYETNGCAFDGLVVMSEAMDQPFFLLYFMWGLLGLGLGDKKMLLWWISMAALSIYGKNLQNSFLPPRMLSALEM